jgi:hypothetical protein
MTRLRLAPAAEHLAAKLQACARDEFRVSLDVLPVLSDDPLPVSIASDIEGFPKAPSP